MTDNKIFRVFKWIFFVLSFLVLLFVIVFLFSGCAEKQELDDLTVVSGIALDSQGEQTSVCNLAVEYVTISSEGTTGKNVEGQILALQGENAFSALREALNKSQNKLYLVHNQLLIFGKTAAEQGLKEHIDFFVRDYEARLNVPVLIADGQAGEILKTKAEGTGLTSEFLKDMIEAQSEQGVNTFTKLLDFTQNITSWEKGTLIPMARIDKTDPEKPALVVDSTAVFVKDKMVGTLDKEKTRGVLWVMGKVKDGLINIETERGQVVVEITGCKVDKKIEVEEGKIKVKVKIMQVGNIGSATDKAGENREQNIKEIQKMTEKAIEKEIVSGFESLKEYGCDVYGLGDDLRRTKPEKWETISDDWPDVFKEARLEVEINSTIDNTGALGGDI